MDEEENPFDSGFGTGLGDPSDDVVAVPPRDLPPPIMEDNPFEPRDFSASSDDSLPPPSNPPPPAMYDSESSSGLSDVDETSSNGSSSDYDAADQDDSSDSSSSSDGDSLPPPSTPPPMDELSQEEVNREEAEADYVYASEQEEALQPEKKGAKNDIKTPLTLTTEDTKTQPILDESHGDELEQTNVDWI